MTYDATSAFTQQKNTQNADAVFKHTLTCFSTKGESQLGAVIKMHMITL